MLYGSCPCPCQVAAIRRRFKEKHKLILQDLMMRKRLDEEKVSWRVHRGSKIELRVTDVRPPQIKPWMGKCACTVVLALC